MMLAILWAPAALLAVLIWAVWPDVQPMTWAWLVVCIYLATFNTLAYGL